MLTINNLTKTFDQVVAVNDVNLQVKSGEILGLIGQNGAGKTTTFRMILNFLTPDSGQITWKNKSLKKVNYDQIGYLPEERGLYPKMKVGEQLTYFAKLHGMKTAEIKQQIPKWMERFQVKGKLTDKVKDLSKGNQQKIQLIATLIHMPKLLILDEPFSGLDPVNADLLRAGILMLRNAGSAIIYSSHNMDYVEKISDNLIMLHNGNVVLSGDITDIRESFGRTKLFLESKLTSEQLANFPGVKIVKQHKKEFELTLSNPDIGKKIFAVATEKGYIPEFRQVPPSLEEIFRLKVGAVNE
ncbi:ABC transporter ATP-binding protein [Ligilactobacillus sp. WILCCON 0076]|uniref:ABC transporter ATP-binding protein n=1 Tax=Ligilactobacillus ubinensis TaxID=2876789 RepID=A0A9X2FGT0_9LACO|nr:ABC transporter ATP-binding protein [Ligilactobacillus ubinensis]MCP0886054.1 ABC transporter ATP-binding protein [Ligilactobacillus ubinensis]